MQNFRCDDCGSSFARQEHLTRHARSHTSERPYNCSECSKSFTRLDVLQRHQASHRKSMTRPGPQSRACKECAAKRVRCTRAQPCERCVAKQIDCVYPTYRQRQQPIDRASPSTNNGDEADGIAQDDLPSAGWPPEGANPMEAAAAFAPIASAQQQYDVRGQQGVGQQIHQIDAGESWNYFLNPGQVYDPSVQCYTGLPNQFADTSAVNWLSPEFPLNFDWTEIQTDTAGFIVPDEHVNLAQDAGTEQMEVDPHQLDDINSSGNVLYAVNSGLPTIAITNSAATANEARDIHKNQRITGSGIDSSSGNLVDHAPSCNHRHADNLYQQTSSPDIPRSPPQEAVLYVEGAAARLPFKGRSAQNQAESQRISQMSVGEGDLISDLSTPGTDHTISTDTNNDGASASATLVSESTYNHLRNQIEESMDQSNQQSPFRQDFLSLGHMRAFFSCYFLHFHPAYSFLPRDLQYYQEPGHWPLLLGVITVGARYAPLKHRRRFESSLATTLMDISTKETLAVKEHISSTPCSCSPSSPPIASRADFDLIPLQTAAISVIYRLGVSPSQSPGGPSISDLVNLCKRLGYLEIVSNANDKTHVSASEWLSGQLKLRTGMMVMVLDTIIAMQSSHNPLLRLGDVTGSIPHAETSMNTGSKSTTDQRQSDAVTLPRALQMLYMEKALPPDLDDLGTTVLISAIYRQTQEVLYQHRSSLSSWIPTARVERPQNSTRNGVQESWPPSLPILSKWRNAACDCLDILHWNANVMIAKAGGWEHPAVMSLHLSRLVLLAPSKYLREMPEALEAAREEPTAMDHHSGSLRLQEIRNKILQWAFNDQYKARLSIIHAGALVWHLRRYRTGNFSEPWAIYTAILVLWAYSKAMQLYEKQQQQNQDKDAEDLAAKGPDSTSVPEPPPFLHLDRPLDDEIVQAYVKYGYKTMGHLAGIGDIRAAGSCDKILRMGIKMLAEHRPGWQPAAALGSGAQSRENTAPFEMESLEKLYSGYLEQIASLVDW